MPDIEHVVVLMFENRSFDHLLGLLSDDLDYPGVRLGDDRFSNPVDPADPSKGRVRVTDDATFAGLGVDPPHSHGSAVELRQMATLLRPKLSAGDGAPATRSRARPGDDDVAALFTARSEQARQQ